MKFIFIQGATASGKSHWALEMQKKFGGAIVNCDSVQVYKDLNVGSSKPTATDLSSAPHLLYSYIETPNRLAAGQYARDFWAVVKNKQYSHFFVVGGTGFYFQALEKGLLPVPAASAKTQEKWFQLLAEKGEEHLFSLLKKQDPLYAQKISAHDHHRLIRALEIFDTTQKNLSSWNQEMQQKENSFPFPLLKVGLEDTKEVLRERVAQRTRQMLSNGWIDEVQKLIDRGFAEWAPLRSTGYQQVLEHLLKTTPLTNLPEEINTASLRLIKKQKTWFRRPSTNDRQQPVQWETFDGRQKLESKIRIFSLS